MNRPDLIAQLEKLSPTEGEWKLKVDEWHGNSVRCLSDKGAIFNSDIASTNGNINDETLIQLAPTMRLEILAMAKEIEELKAQNEILLYSARKNNPS